MKEWYHKETESLNRWSKEFDELREKESALEIEKEAFEKEKEEFEDEKAAWKAGHNEDQDAEEFK
jgi:hypothetical protein